MLIIPCPNCGARNASEFHNGGEYHPRPETAGAEEWTGYLYLKNNCADRHTEWWFHRAGCGLWFLAERHTATNQIYQTYRWQPNGVDWEAEG